MDKYINSDYLPQGWTFDKILAELEAGSIKTLTKENLAEFIDPRLLNMSEAEIADYIKQLIKDKNISLFNSEASMPKFNYAENLDKTDELNQEFTDPEDK